MLLDSQFQCHLVHMVLGTKGIGTKGVGTKGIETKSKALNLNCIRWPSAHGNGAANPPARTTKWAPGRVGGIGDGGGAAVPITVPVFQSCVLSELVGVGGEAGQARPSPAGHDQPQWPLIMRRALVMGPRAVS